MDEGELPGPRLRPITGAFVEVIPHERRDAAFARVARGAGRPILQTVPPGRSTMTPALEGGDIAIGLFVRLGCTCEREPAGIVMLSERHAAHIVQHRSAAERVFLIDALTIDEAMARWKPPLRSLLAATAVTLVATLYHDAAIRTYVACRVPADDSAAGAAIAAIGGSPLVLPAGIAHPRLSFGSVPSSELHFIDAAGAASAAQLVANHYDGTIVPVKDYDLPGRGTGEAMLSVALPRPFRYLIDEIRLIAEGAVDLGWRTPTIIGNDLAFPLRAARGN